MGGFSTLPTIGPADKAARNPLLDELDALGGKAVHDTYTRASPELKEALRRSGMPVPRGTPPDRISSSPQPSPLGTPPDAGPVEPPAPIMPSAAPQLLAPGEQDANDAAAMRLVTREQQRAHPAPITSAPAGPPPIGPAAQHAQEVASQPNRISQIHNPWLRGLATAGDVVAGTFAPRAEQLIPGTFGHHALEIAQAEKAADQEAQQQERGSKAQESQSKVGVDVANARHLNAEAANLENPMAKGPTNEVELYHQNPKEGAAFLNLKNPGKEQGAAKTIETDQGILQWNPQSERYDIRVGQSAEKKGGTVHQLEDGRLILAHPDGTATQITVNGEPAKGKTTSPSSTPEQQFIDEYRAKKPGASVAEAQRAFEKNKQLTPLTDRGENFVDPDTGKLVRVEPGQAIPKGGQKPAQVSEENTTTRAMQTRQEQAKVINEAGNALINSIEQHRDKLGNLSSYWTQATNGTPIADPTVSGLMTQIASFAALQPALHGFRGAQAMAEFEKSIGGIPKNPDALEAAIKAIQGTANIMAHPGQTTAAPAQMMRARDPQGKLYEAPAGTPLPAGWKAE